MHLEKRTISWARTRWIRGTKISLGMENNICLADVELEFSSIPRHSGETIATPLNVRLFSFELAADVSSSFPPVSSREGPALTRWARERNIYFSRICLENLENPRGRQYRNRRPPNETRVKVRNTIVKYKLYLKNYVNKERNTKIFDYYFRALTLTLICLHVFEAKFL